MRTWRHLWSYLLQVRATAPPPPLRPPQDTCEAESVVHRKGLRSIWAGHSLQIPAPAFRCLEFGSARALTWPAAEEGFTIITVIITIAISITIWASCSHEMPFQVPESWPAAIPDQLQSSPGLTTQLLFCFSVLPAITFSGFHFKHFVLFFNSTSS